MAYFCEHEIVGDFCPKCFPEENKEGCQERRDAAVVSFKLCPKCNIRSQPICFICARFTASRWHALARKLWRERKGLEIACTRATNEAHDLRMRVVELEAVLAEQDEAIRAGSRLLSLADEVGEQVRRAIERSDRLPQSILAKAFSGELVPTEAELARSEGRNYEPASVLLERIQAERAAQGNGATASKPKRTRNGTNGRPDVAPAEVAIEEEVAEVQTNGNGHTAAPRKSIDQVDTDEVMAAFRLACWGLGDARIDRDELLRRTAQKLGYAKLGQNIREVLKGHLCAAIRRKIVGVEGQNVYSMTPTAGSFDTESLLETLASVTQKNREHERDEVIRAAAKHLGFSQVTDAFREQMKSAFNAAVRRGVLERRGAEIVVRVG